MSKLMQVRVSSRNEDGQDYCEGTVTIPGLKPTKIVKKSDGSTRFPNRGVLLSAARSLATSLNFTGVGTEEPGKTTATAKKSPSRNLSSTLSTVGSF